MDLEDNGPAQAAAGRPGFDPARAHTLALGTPTRHTMLIDQTEIDSLLSQANALAAETVVEEAAPPAPPPRRELKLPDEPEMRRVLRLRVPVIVRLAYRAMSVKAIRALAPGAIIEFEKSVEEDLELLINNHLIGRGVCVKVDEYFGVRLTAIEERAQRIRSMGA